VKDSIQLKYQDSGVTALWEFTQGHPEKRLGAMVILKSLESVSTAIGAALKDTSHYASSAGNTMHIALLGDTQMNTAEDRYVHVHISADEFIWCNS
jgi:acetyl-CoA carboxylase/biotin carboxylase 1